MAMTPPGMTPLECGELTARGGRKVRGLSAGAAARRRQRTSDGQDEQDDDDGEGAEGVADAAGELVKEEADADEGGGEGAEAEDQIRQSPVAAVGHSAGGEAGSSVAGARAERGPHQQLLQIGS